MSRRQFLKLLGGGAQRRSLGPKESCIEEKVSRVTTLSLVLRGRLLVSQVLLLLLLNSCFSCSRLASLCMWCRSISFWTLPNGSGSQQMNISRYGWSYLLAKIDNKS